MPRSTKRDAMIAERRTGRPHELFDGVLYEKPRDIIRGHVVLELGFAVMRYLDEHDLGFCMESRATYAFGRGVVVSPDLSFVPWNRTPNRRVPRDPIPNLVPSLAADVLGTASTPEVIARRHGAYFRYDVRLAWVIDPKKMTADIYTAPDAKATIDASGVLDGGDVLPGFRVPLAKLFEQLADPAPAKKPRKKK